MSLKQMKGSKQEAKDTEVNDHNLEKNVWVVY